MARTKKPSWRIRFAALLLLATLAVGGWLWWNLIHWTPPEETYPDQGVLAGAEDGLVNFRTIRALGGDFAYLEASDGAGGQDARFARNYAAARQAKLQVGALHKYDPCVPADGQSANFVTMVPRDPALLPPVIELSRIGDTCETRVSDASVESELMTLINQIETHAGKAVILKIDPAFEVRYHLAPQLARGLWLTRTRFPPEYAGRPWVLWTANSDLHSEASDHPLRWVVVQP